MRLGNGINVIAGSIVTISGNTFEGLGVAPDASGTGISMSAGARVTLINNTFTNLVGPGILSFDSTLTAMGNTFRGGEKNGDFADGMELVRTSADIISNQFIELGRIAIGTFIPDPDAAPRVTSTVNIINNLIAACGLSVPDAGIGLQLAASANTRNVFNVLNNTIVESTLCTILYAVSAGGSSVQLVNNILASSGGNADMLVTQMGAQRLNLLTARNNLIERDLLMLVNQNGNFSADPRFVDPGMFNYRLQANSPAINKGDSAAAGLPMTDLDGNPRIAGGAVDAGAYEFQP
jgi:hypothetical protein